MKILIIGSRGYLGKNLLSSLKLHEIEVVGLSSSDGSGINRETGLFHNLVIPTDVNVVIYMSQSPYFKDVPNKAAHVVAVNNLAAVQAAVAAREAGVDRFIYLSTGSVYAPSFSALTETSPLNRKNWYAVSKIHAEEALKLFEQDMEIIVVRPFGIYGPGQHGRLIPNLIASIKQKRPIVLSRHKDRPEDLEGMRISICYRDDAIDVLSQLAINGGPSILNLAGDVAVSIKEIAQMVGELVGVQPHLEIANQARDGDLIADINLLMTSKPTNFTALVDGLKNSIDFHRI